MYTALQIAAYIMSKYPSIDEMRLHKLLYFMQRESLALNSEPLFEDLFEAWKYGPVLRCVRESYKAQTLLDNLCDIDSKTEELIKRVYIHYDQYSSWTLSNLTHCETSWQKARKDIPDGCNGDIKIPLADIQKDANRYSYRTIAQNIHEVVDDVKRYLSERD